LQAQLGESFLNGVQSPEDPERAADCFQEAMALLSEASMPRSASEADTQQSDKTTRVARHRQRPVHTQDRTQYPTPHLLGRCAYGLSVALRISADRLQMGAEGGRVDAEEEREALGKQAVRWLQEAADAGFVPACLELGLIYLARSCFASSILASGFSMEG
jgi:TPR repeat protein